MTPVVKFSNNNITISLTNLRKIANFIGTMINSADAVEFLEEHGISRKQIETKEQPSRLIYHVFKQLDLAADEPNHRILKKLIVDSINPALYDGSNIKEQDILTTYNEWLSSEGKKIILLGKNGYRILEPAPYDSKLDEIVHEELEMQEDIFVSMIFDYIKDIAEIRDAYKLLMQIVDTFSEKIYPVDQQLNDYYINLFDRVETKINYLHTEIMDVFKKANKGDPFFISHMDSIQPYIYKSSEGRNIFYKPFTNLYLAEEEIKEKHTSLEEIKRNMSICYGFIEKNYYRFGADTAINLPHQDFFNEVVKFLGKFNDKEDMQLFGFTDKTFFITRIDGPKANINFHPRAGETLGPFHLIKAMVDYLKIHGAKNGGWVEVSIPRSELIEILKKKTSITETINGDWIRFTKGNLIKKIPTDYKELIDISDFKRKTQDYHFAIKLPR